METKAAWKSSGFWGLIVTAALEAAERAGALPSGLSGIVLTVFQAMAMGLALFGRWRATKPLSLT